MSRQTLPLSVRVGVQTLRANPMRTVLSTLGVVMGARVAVIGYKLAADLTAGRSTESLLESDLAFSGARRRDIYVQFLAESVVISLAGAIIGAFLGIAGAYLVTCIMRTQTMAQGYAAVSWQTLLAAMGAAILVGLVFGTYPALKAANLSPVEAMRYE